VVCSSTGGAGWIYDEWTCRRSSQELYRVAPRCVPCLPRAAERLMHCIGERIEARRYAAVLVLRELTRQAPSLVYDHVPELLDNLWTALRDPKVSLIAQSTFETSRTDSDSRSRFVRQQQVLLRDASSLLASVTVTPSQRRTRWSSSRLSEDSRSTRQSPSTDLCWDTRSCSSRGSW
jgi:hypothetical protein